MRRSCFTFSIHGARDTYLLVFVDGAGPNYPCYVRRIPLDQNGFPFVDPQYDWQTVGDISLKDGPDATVVPAF
jgi:hypothetical protein